MLRNVEFFFANFAKYCDFFSPNLSNLPPFENFVHCGNLLQFCAMAMFCKLCAIWRFCTCYAMWHFCVQCGNLLRITHSLVTLAKVVQCGISFCKLCKILRFFANLSNLSPFVNLVHFLQFCTIAFFCKHCAIWHFCNCHAIWHFLCEVAIFCTFCTMHVQEKCIHNITKPQKRKKRKMI